MKLSATLAAVALALVGFTTPAHAGLDPTVHAPRLAIRNLKQATRELIAIRRLRVTRGLSKRQLPGPSAVAG
jgi:hypothetical protein